ncbi:MAG: hypothetical protein ACRBM6_18075 [Geminicoccales bacterium]
MTRMYRVGLFPLIAIFALIAGTAGPLEAQSNGAPLDQDPLRHYLPDDNTFMPVPGGVSALTTPSAEADTIEEKAAQLHGGLIVGYCLRASCRYVTHLVVIQVCFNQISGPDGSDKLVLAVIRLPYGKTPGHMKSLQGRDYAYNFEAYGPFEQVMPLGSLSDKVEALYALAADGVGPIAPLDYQGSDLKNPQSDDTLALHMTMYKNDAGAPYPYFQVRHLCQQPVS